MSTSRCDSVVPRGERSTVMKRSDMADHHPPHAWVGPTLRRRGGFFLHGSDEDRGATTGAAWVQWEAPAQEEGQAAPVVLVHGGGGQSTDWMWAVDGQPGWAELFVGAGHPTYLLDRPGHGRSPWDPETMGGRGPIPDSATLAGLFQIEEQELLPDARFAAVSASSTGLLSNAARAQATEAERLIQLLDMVGPSIMVAHSAGAPGVWLAADRAPHLVELVVAVEPLGPPFGGNRHAAALSEGVTAFPLNTSRCPENGRPQGLGQVPIVVVTAQASGHLGMDRETTAFLEDSADDVEHLRLGEHGIDGDGHGVIFDANSTAAFHLLHSRYIRAGE